LWRVAFVATNEFGIGKEAADASTTNAAIRAGNIGEHRL
jgi:hypothetical protein